MRRRFVLPLAALACAVGLGCSSSNNNSSGNASKPVVSSVATTASTQAATKPAGAAATAAPASAAATTAAAASPAAAAKPTGESIKLGLIVAMSGPSASVGEHAKKGADLAVEQINAEGGVLGRPLEVVIGDEQAKADEAVKRLREFNDKNIKLTFGYTTTAECLAATPIAEQIGSLVISSYCQDNSLVGDKFSKSFFRLTSDTEMIARAPAISMAKRFPDVKQWATIAPDYAYGHGVEATFVKQMQKSLPGFQLAKQVFPPFQAPAFQDYITSLQSANAQGILTAQFSGDLLALIKQAKPFNLFTSSKPLVIVGGDLDSLIPLGKDAPDAWDSTLYYYTAFDTAQNKKFVDGFQKKYNTYPIGLDRGTYDAIYGIKAAIEKAKSADPDKVAKALEGLSYDGTMGKFTVRPEDHQTVIEKIVVFHVVPAPETAEGFKITDLDFVNGADVTSPPHPGSKGEFDQ